MAGCQGRPVGPATASGEVRLHGRPLAGGIVVFTPDHDRGSTGRPIAVELQQDGQFRMLDSVPPGWYRVSISDPAGSWQGEFPSELRRPDRSGLLREIVAGRAHRFDFHIAKKN